MASSDSGADVFMRVKNGNGAFVTQPAVANTGTGIISVGNVVNTALLTGHDYSITFTSATTYDVTDTTTATPVSSGNAYVSGQAISFDGMQFEIKGAPAIGDTFTVTPSVNENIFKTVSDLIGALNTPVAGANLSNSLLHSVNQLDNALNNVLNTRVTLGLRLNEVDALDAAGEDLGLQFKKTLSELQDTDYNKAISDLSQQQMSLQAAQQSFVKVTGLSLFNYL
jgi:flagellar hook-associated protein 3 FlgL